MLVQQFLERSADTMPDKVALICENERLTYVEVEQQANRLANTLLENGFERGQRVALYLPNSIALVIAIFSVLKAGGTFVVINPTTKREKLLYILENCAASMLITQDRSRELAVECLQGVDSMRWVVLCPGINLAAGQKNLGSYQDIQAHASAERPKCRNIDLDLACLIYTSGTTGDPKGVMSDHSNVDFATGSIIAYLQNHPGDIVINCLPLSFDYGLYQLFMVFKIGGTLVLERSFAYPAAVLQRMQQEQVTGFPGVPTMFALLLQMDLSAYDLSSLRYLSNTAAALPLSHIERVKRTLPQAHLFSMYGLTETKRTLYLPPEQLSIRPDSVGIAIPGTEVWVEDPNGVRLGPNQVGELVVRGRHVMRGYWRDPEATATRFRDGPLPGERLCYSGDLFRMDHEGYFYFVGRMDDIIKSRGEKVAPKEVENVLYALDGVVEAAVIGVPDTVLGEAIKAFLVVSDGSLTAMEVMAHCKEHLEDYMVPRQVEFRKELPKTSSGKIKKDNLN